MVKQKIISFSEKKPTKKQSDDYVVRVHTIVTMLRAADAIHEREMQDKDRFAMEALNTVKSELTADEYRLLTQYLDSEARDMRNTSALTLRDDSPISDLERAHVLILQFGHQNFDSFETQADQFKPLYIVSKQNEAISDSLIQINQYEKQIFRDAIDIAWERFDETKNPSDMKMAQNLDKALKGVEKRIQTIQKTASIAKQDTKNIIKSAESQGIKKIDLEKAAKDKTGLKIRLNNNDDLGKALGQVEAASKQNIKDLDKLLNLPKGKTIDDLIFGPDAKPSGQGTTVKPLDGTKSEGDSAKFFDQYYDLSDHIPVKAVFENWENLQQTKADAQTIKEIDHGTDSTDSEQAAITTDTKTEPVENEEPTETQSGRQVSVLVIGGKYYPQSQFHVVEAHTPNCDSLHYHSPYSSVRSTDGTAISDPSPSTCGFGKVGLIAVDVVTMTQEQIDAFKEVMGFEP